ncbi:MAG: VanW family protein [Candidatus Woesearchaeota archaeon]
MKKLLKRSNTRVRVGKLYYIFKRYKKWLFNRMRFADTYFGELMDYAVFQHKTPLIRKLRNLDMWMQYNKVKNLQVATKKINKIVIYPGETFSYWRLIGKPTRRKGYVEGAILSNGKLDTGVGGGLCQLSNLIFWMTLHTPLTVTERHRHTYDVFPDSNRTLPFGSGATCVYNYIDLQIYNDTDQAYQLIVYLTKDYLIGEWRTASEPDYKYEVYEKEHWITHEYRIGYVRHNIICRKIYNSKNEIVDDQYITENHALMMYQPFLKDSYYNDNSQA